jgi:hypothetical protein
MRENPDHFEQFFEDDESDYKQVMWWKDKVSYIKAKNSDPSFNREILDGQATHSMLQLAVEGVFSENAVQGC